MKFFIFILNSVALFALHSLADHGLPIGQLKTQDHIVFIYTAKGLSSYRVQYLATDKVSDVMDLGMLQKAYPELAELVEQGIADDASLEGRLESFNPWKE